MAPSIKLTYFDIEGRAEPVRLALVLSGTEFEDERIPFDKWPELKPTTPHGTLPVMTIDNGPMRTESCAMLRWVGATFGGDKELYPADKLMDIEEAIGLVDDMMQSWMPNLYLGMRPSKYGYPEDFAKTEAGQEKIAAMRKKWIAEELPKWMGFITDMLNKNGGKWLVKGENPTIADCMLVPILRNFTKGHVDYVSIHCLNSYPAIEAYVERFCALPGVKGRYTTGLGSVPTS